MYFIMFFSKYAKPLSIISWYERNISKNKTILFTGELSSIYEFMSSVRNWASILDVFSNIRKNYSKILIKTDFLPLLLHVISIKLTINLFNDILFYNRALTTHCWNSKHFYHIISEQYSVFTSYSFMVRVKYKHEIINSLW